MNQTRTNPTIGMLATVRNRRAIVTSVDPYDSPDGRFHMVGLDYIDADGTPSDTLLWEREINATLLEPIALPEISRTQPMITGDFDALQRATRWMALAPFVTPGSEEPPQAIAAPLFGAVQAEDFQLVPLLKALQMPRISLL
ncbi:MAG: DNA helicase, partial [Chloroflexi bacterium]|nr:DNA helicase [Chloroflexota bacterium]